MRFIVAVSSFRSIGIDLALNCKQVAIRARRHNFPLSLRLHTQTGPWSIAHLDEHNARCLIIRRGRPAEEGAHVDGGRAERHAAADAPAAAAACSTSGSCFSVGGGGDGAAFAAPPLPARSRGAPPGRPRPGARGHRPRLPRPRDPRPGRRRARPPRGARRDVQREKTTVCWGVIVCVRVCV